MECLKVEAVNSSPSIGKKKKINLSDLYNFTYQTVIIIASSFYGCWGIEIVIN
jgi:hypothetical protein